MLKPRRYGLKLACTAGVLALAVTLAACGGPGTPPGATAAKPAATPPKTHKAKPNRKHKRTKKAAVRASKSKTAATTKVVFVNVGQGDAVVLKRGSWAGEIDGGPPGSEGVIEAALHRLGVRRLNAVVITHPHADHTGGLQGVILDEDPRVAYVGEGAGCDADELRRVGAKVVRVHRGQTLHFGSLRAQVLNPSGLSGDPNDDSVVLLLDIAGRRMLFTGDVGGAEEDYVGAVLARGPPLYLLKVAHHGSQYSTSAAFLGETDPRYAVVCVGPNSYGHPTPETVARLRADGTRIYTTQKNGSITVTVSAKGAVSWSFSQSSRPVTKGATRGHSGEGSGSAVTAGSASSGTTVYITETGECYHVKGCRYLSHSCIPISLKKAKAEGYRPCSVCDPPR